MLKIMEYHKIEKEYLLYQLEMILINILGNEKYLNVFNYFSLAIEALASIIFCLICNGESQFNDCMGILFERLR